MSDYTENAANEIAELALADELLTGDMKIVQNIAEIMGASSQTLEESFLTAVRVRRAEKRARELLASRAAAREKAQAAGDADPAQTAAPRPTQPRDPADRSASAPIPFARMILTGLRARANAAPVMTAAIILAGFVLVMLAPILLIGPVDLTGGTGTLEFDTLIYGLPFQIVLTLAILLCVWLTGWWRRTLLITPVDRRGLRPLYITLLYPLFGVVTFVALLAGDATARDPFQSLALVLALNAFVGLSEELLFRGIVFGALRQTTRLITAITVSSVLFGLLHLVNAGTGQDWQQTLFQVINTTALGVLFCALALSANSLWPAIVLHMIWNSYAMMGLAAAESFGDAPGTDVAPPELSPWNLTLPALILLIALGILYGYRQMRSVRLTRVVPGPVDGPAA